jgi:hypothetical protein
MQSWLLKCCYQLSQQLLLLVMIQDKRALQFFPMLLLLKQWPQLWRHL